MSLEEILGVIPGMSDDVRAIITANESACSIKINLEGEGNVPSRDFITANGRVFAPEGHMVKKEDLELLLSMELSKAKGVTKLLLPHLSFENNAQFDAVAQAFGYLVQQDSKEHQRRSDLEAAVLAIESEMGIDSNPLRFSWNDGDNGDSLQVRKVAESVMSCLIQLTQ